MAFKAIKQTQKSGLNLLCIQPVPAFRGTHLLVCERTGLATVPQCMEDPTSLLMKPLCQTRTNQSKFLQGLQEPYEPSFTIKNHDSTPTKTVGFLDRSCMLRFVRLL